MSVYICKPVTLALKIKGGDPCKSNLAPLAGMPQALHHWYRPGGR